MRDWLALVDAVSALPTKAERIARAERVRAAIGSDTAKQLRWNLDVCDRLDASIGMVR